MSRSVYRNIGSLLSLRGAHVKQGRKVKEQDLGILKNAALVVENDSIIWVGLEKNLGQFLKSKKNVEEVNLQGSTVLPGLIDCHTHSVFAGSRADEFELRNQGATYQEIAQKGGGILSTVKKTRAASKAELLKSAKERVRSFIKQGVTTVEMKSGYGLSLEDEIKCLEVINDLRGITIIPTFLGAHAKPPEFSSHGEYLQHLSLQILPEVKRKCLAERVDIFIEKGFFENPEARKFLALAQALGFAITIHADQLTLSGGAEVALEMKALSADHVIQINDSLVEKLSMSEVTSVLLPIADFYLKCAYPPARKLIDSGAKVALATDFNPGTSPSQSLNFAGVLARLEMKMSLPEVISAFTVGAAGALKVESQRGSLITGMKADFVVMNMDWDQMFYSVGDHQVSQVVRNGRAIFRSASKTLK